MQVLVKALADNTDAILKTQKEEAQKQINFLN
jgi:hypothetical protein